MDRADVRLLEPLQRLVEPRRRIGIVAGVARARSSRSRKPQLQLARGLLGERHRDDLADRPRALRQDA